MTVVPMWPGGLPRPTWRRRKAAAFLLLSLVQQCDELCVLRAPIDLPVAFMTQSRTQ